MGRKEDALLGYYDNAKRFAWLGNADQSVSSAGFALRSSNFHCKSVCIRRRP